MADPVPGQGPKRTRDIRLPNESGTSDLTTERSTARTEEQRPLLEFNNAFSGRRGYQFGSGDTAGEVRLDPNNKTVITTRGTTRRVGPTRSTTSKR